MRKYLVLLLPAIALGGCGSPPAIAPVHNIAERHPELVELLDQRLRSLHDGFTGLEDEVPEQIDADLRERLRALGYLGDQGERADAAGCTSMSDRG